MKEAHHMGYRLLSGIKNGFILKFSLDYYDEQKKPNPKPTPRPIKKRKDSPSGLRKANQRPTRWTPAVKVMSVE